MSHQDRFMSSRELLNRIGLSDDAPQLLGDEDCDALDGDLAPVLRARFQQLQTRHRFAPGDLVTWKAGLNNHQVPKPGQPAVVVEVLEQPVYDTDEQSCGTYFREPLDLVLGLIWEDGQARGAFVTFYFNSQRFEPYAG